MSVLIQRALLFRRITGGVAGAIATATLFYQFGYSGEATALDLLRELAIGFASYVTAALLAHWIARNSKRFWDIAIVSLFGSVLSFFFKLIQDGPNGIPSYVAKSVREHSWQPFADLATDAVLSILFFTLMALPFVGIAMLLCHFLTRKVTAESDLA